VQTTPVVTSYPSQQFVVLNATGYVVAQRKAAIASKATGRLEWLGVAEGSRVKAGEVIARLGQSRRAGAGRQRRGERARGTRGARTGGGRGARCGAAAEAQCRSRGEGIRVRGHRRCRDRAPRPRDGGRRSARAAIGAAEANARNARVSVDFTLIRAPFDGVILSKSANVGDIITPFSSAADSKGAVVTMADMATLEVEADVSESSLSKVRVGQPAEIALDALPERASGRISRMVPTVDRAKRR